MPLYGQDSEQSDLVLDHLFLDGLPSFARFKCRHEWVDREMLVGILGAGIMDATICNHLGKSGGFPSEHPMLPGY